MRYRTLVADPPWDHSDGTGITVARAAKGRGGQRSQVRVDSILHSTRPPYEAMGLDAIKALPVAELAEDNAHLYLWTTNRYLRSVWDVAEAWGFRGVCILTWCKPERGFLGGGAYPSNTEFCLFARRGSLPATSRGPGRWFRWPRRSGTSVVEGEWGNPSHSSKPEAFLDLVEAVSPGPYLELFARRNRLGWDTWGNESLEHIEVAT